ncbi:Anoctamin-5 [Eumeta japonica]|uniref:Anoctamin n=1 Tax=Eumeta variegata TaxID=151549 RepID=A0A4C1Z5G5_EUMVA|nr:Anoctamin-5 [Eumeta japonica]
MPDPLHLGEQMSTTARECRCPEESPLRCLPLKRDKEICDIYGPGNTTLCPLCDKACQYQQLADSCLFAKLTYLFDNPATVFFAIFMSFWATTFLELWKRKQSVLRWEWDLGGVDHDEEPRPEFEASIKTFRTNPVTRGEGAVSADLAENR